MPDQQLVEESHKPIIRKVENGKVHSFFILIVFYHVLFIF